MLQEGESSVILILFWPRWVRGPLPLRQMEMSVIYEKLARTGSIDGVAGVISPCGPDAKGISVWAISHWDGRVHQMRSLELGRLGDIHTGIAGSTTSSSSPQQGHMPSKRTLRFFSKRTPKTRIRFGKSQFNWNG